MLNFHVHHQGSSSREILLANFTRVPHVTIYMPFQKLNLFESHIAHSACKIWVRGCLISTFQHLNSINS